MGVWGPMSKDDEAAAIAYSAGKWGESFPGNPKFRANYEAGKAEFEARGGPPDMFHDPVPAWER